MTAPVVDAGGGLVERVAAARLPTDQGTFDIVAHRAADGVEHLAVVAGDPARATSALVRVHSECLTGDVLGSLRCDCGAQLATALRRIDEEAAAGSGGVVVYVRGHEGRGIGLANKIRAYELQEAGLDTVDANAVQGLPVDARRYEVAAAILTDLGIGTVRLMTNNPAKVDALAAAGITVAAVEPLVVAVGPEAGDYLSVKRDRMGHRLPPSS